MAWIVLGEKNGRILLVSKNQIDGILPKGAYLTVESEDAKFILRVDDSQQSQTYAPTPMVVDMDLQPLQQDQKCQNIITAFRVKDITSRDDGLIDYIRPQLKARRSTQDEVNLATSGDRKGPKVFLATVHANSNQLLADENKKFITTNIPEDAFFHQMLICGKTGSGKTVAMKYFAQYFVEEMGGAVLAVNVKESDFLMLNRPSIIKNVNAKKEFEALGKGPKGVDNFTVYCPANTEVAYSKKVDHDRVRKVTLKVEEIDPESLAGLLQNISDRGAQSLPNIFRFWVEKEAKKGQRGKGLRFADFVNYFSNAEEDDLRFQTLNQREEESSITMHRGTFENIRRSLDIARDFFDNDEAESLDVKDIIQPSKISVIDVAVKNGKHFGAILLRDLLHKIVVAKEQNKSELPVLIIIDEVHSFYNTNSMEDALGDLDLICRTGRSQKIGVIFASQNPSDIPSGLSSVINTKIFFKTDTSLAKAHSIASSEEMENLSTGFAAVSIHELPQVKAVKFPISFSGVFEG